jgi:hypothetical protein
MRPLQIIALTCLVLIWTRLAPGQGIEGVSVVQSLASPERYTGKWVTVRGFLHLEFEGNALYLHQEDYDHMLLKNAVWIDANSDVEKQKASLSDHYVTIIGMFRAGDDGHMGLFSGSLTNIKHVEVAKSRKDVDEILKRTLEKKK